MNIKDIQESLPQDTNINPTELAIESARTPNLYCKYLKEHFIAEEQLRMRRAEYQIVWRNRWEYYMGKADDEVYKEKPLLKKHLPGPIIDIYLPADEAVQKGKLELERAEYKVKYLEKVLKFIENRSFLIGHIQDDYKFKNGIR